MTANGWLQILLFLALVFLVTKPMGIFMTRVFKREKTFMDPMLRPLPPSLAATTASKLLL
jgi:K+-transporting ATPase ATPase A chain